MPSIIMSIICINRIAALNKSVALLITSSQQGLHKCRQHHFEFVSLYLQQVPYAIVHVHVVRNCYNANARVVSSHSQKSTQLLLSVIAAFCM